MAQRPPHQCSDVFTPVVLVSTPDVLFPCWEVHPIFHLFLHQDVTLPSHLHFQALLLTLWTFLPSAGRFSLAGGLRPAGLRGPRQGGSPVCPVRPLLFYCFWPLPPLLTQSMKHVVVHSCLKAGTEGLTDSFVWGDEGGGAGSGRPWGTTWLPSRGHAHHLHWQVSGGLVSWAGQTPLFCRRVDWAQAGLGNLSLWLYLHGGGPGVVRGRALSGQRSSGLRQAGGSRLSTAPAHLQTASGPPPRSEVPRPREPR